MFYSSDIGRDADIAFRLSICMSVPRWYSLTSSSAVAERRRDARVTSIRKTAKWNFLATLLGA